VDITLPYLPYTMVIVDDMLGNVPKLRYSDHDMRDVAKFPDLAEETYLTNTGEIGPLCKLIMEHTQWIMGLYKYGIMNLLDITYFRHGKNVRLFIKKIVICVH
jgi:hypothetical protein